MHLFHKIIISVIIITSAGISAEDYKLYKVQEGDTLHKIAKEQLNDARKWKEFLKYNKIDSPNLIRPGLELKIPASLAKQQPSQANPIASLDKKIGNVKKKANQEKDWSNTVTGAFLFNDDLIRTQEKSAAEINFFKDPTVIITIRENSILKVRQDKVKSGELSFGEIYVNVSDKIKSKESKFNIVTSAAVGGVRGTEYALGVDKDETSKFACYTGMMEVSAQGETVKLPAGYGTYVIKGQAPVKPFLLPGDVKIKMPAGK